VQEVQPPKIKGRKKFLIEYEDTYIHTYKFYKVKKEFEFLKETKSTLEILPP
jgi:hypothetical protein